MTTNLARSSRVRLLPLLLASLGLGLGGGCRNVEHETRAEREANAKKVTADSTDDATEPIVDEDFQFVLELPGPGWKLLREHDAAGINPDAIAAAISVDGPAYGVVIVEPMPNASLEQLQGLVWSRELPELVVESEIDLDFQGVPARRRVFTATIEGKSYRYVSTIFVRQDHAYQLVSWSMSTAAVDKPLSFHDAFKLRDGKVEGRKTVHAPIVTADGVGWRIREGRYESALTGLRLTPPDGWRYVIGSELELLGSDAEIMLVNEQLNAYLAVVVERVSESRLEDLAATTRGQFEARQGQPLETFTRSVAGREVELGRYGSGPTSYVFGIYIGDGAVVQLSGWSPMGFADELLPALEPVYAGLEQLPAAERAELRTQLLASSSGPPRFTSSRVYRGGEFLDFEHLLRWTEPDGFWHADNFDDALAHSQETVLRATESDLGVYLAIEAFTSEADPADTLANMIDGDQLLASDVTVVNGSPVHRAQTISHSMKPAFTYDIAITRRGPVMVAATAWTADDSPAHRKRMADAIESLEYAVALDETRIADGVYHDVRHGFSFALPNDLSGPKVTALPSGQVTAWASGRRELVVVAATGITSDDERWTTSFFEQVLRDQVSGRAELGAPERSDGKLGAHTTRHVRWKHGLTTIEADILTRGPAVFCLIYANLGDIEISNIQSSWSMLY